MRELSGNAVRLMWSIHMHNLHKVMVSVQEINHLIIAIVILVDGTDGFSCTRSIATHSAPHARTSLRTRARWVCASVFAMSNTQVGVLCLGLDTINCLDGIWDVRKIDKRTIPIDNSACQPLKSRKSTDTHFSLRKLTSSMSPYSPKSRFSLSSVKVS